MNLADWIHGWAGFSPDKPALVFAGRAISYGQMRDRVAATANYLARDLGLRRGDRVAYLGLNRPECFYLLFACAELGLIYQPVNWRLAPPEHAAVLNDGAPKILVAEPAWQATVDDLRPALGIDRYVALDGPRKGWEVPGWEVPGRGREPDGEGRAADAGRLDDPVLLVHSSGTTGLPKGVVLDQNALFFNAINATHMNDLSHADRVLCDLPLFHVGGLNNQALPALHAGATVILRDKFDPTATLAAIAAHRPSLTCLVPAQLEALLAHPDWPDADISCLRAILTGSTFVPVPLIQRIHACGVPVTQIYGTTETAPVAVYLRAEQALDHVGSTGKPAIHCRMRIVDGQGQDVGAGEKGEIWIAGPNVMRKYWRRPEETAQVLTDGWFHTGDIGYTDPQGFLFVVDRKKDMIISGGENIYPAELEHVLAGMPGIAELAVVGQADERWGEVPVAVIVADPPGGLCAADILARFHGRLARFKHPKRVVFMDALPRNAMGKIQKGRIADMLTSGESEP